MHDARAGWLCLWLFGCGLDGSGGLVSGRLVVGDGDHASDLEALDGGRAGLGWTDSEGHGQVRAGQSECRMGHPEGACDRCPDRPCRQVRWTLAGPSSASGWATYCGEGNLQQEAWIACLCAGGLPVPCRAAAGESVRALWFLEHAFGGRVPSVGTRYQSGDGRRGLVDRALHDWLAAAAGPRPVLRCGPFDIEGATARYASDAQRVRVEGRCLR